MVKPIVSSNPLQSRLESILNSQKIFLGRAAVGTESHLQILFITKDYRNATKELLKGPNQSVVGPSGSS